MPPNPRSLFPAFLVFSAAAELLGGPRITPAQQPTAQESIACRVVESKMVATLGVKLIVFHHAESAARRQLGEFLESHDATGVEFEVAGGDWQPATVFRLKSCFGRGLLAFPAARARLAPGQTFLIRASVLNRQTQ